MTRPSLPLLIVSVLAACGGTTTMPQGRPILESELESTTETSPSTGSIQTSPVETNREVSPATSEPITSTSEPAAETDMVDVGCTSISIPTGSTEIIGERCDPDPLFPGARPAVLVLNGCGGYLADADIGRTIARALNREGIVSVRIDYLGAAPVPTTCDEALSDLQAAAEPILRAIADTAALLRLDPTIETGSIGAVGYSLGALTVMSAVLGGAGLSTIEAVPLSPVALLSYPDLLPEVTAGLAAGFGPALFVMSGDADASTPPADAQAVVEAALQGAVPVEQLLVGGQGHLWTGPTATLAASMIADELADRFAN
jgi:dienelactone hydrolase